MASKKKIVEALMKIPKKSDPSHGFNMPTGISTEKEANHFFLGIMLDRLVKASTAWNSAELIVNKYGNGETNFWKKIKTVKKKKLHVFMKSGNDGKALHRFHEEMTENLQLAAELMLEKYNGDPREIWQGQENIGKIKERFEEFQGIGSQLSSMAVTFLASNYQKQMKSLRSLLPRKDDHSKRVFNRTGLTDGKTTVLATAKKLYPDFPAILDFPIWIIARKYCFNSNPKCEECPITGVCNKNIE